MAKVKMEKIIDNFNVLTDKPTKYLTVQSDIKKDIKNLVKSLYDFTKSHEQTDKTEKDLALKKIIVNEFDEEQIWQQIELQNTQCCDRIVWDVANLMSNKNDLTFPIKFPEVITYRSVENDSEVSKSNNDLSDNEIIQKKKHTTELRAKAKDNTKSKGKVSIVDDQFFKLKDMEDFLLKEEKMEGKLKKSNHDDDDESIDMFDDIDSDGSEDEGGKDMMYSDFFNQETDVEMENVEDKSDNDFNDKEHTHSNKRVRFVESESDESDSDGNNELEPIENDIANGPTNEDVRKSDFELRQQRLKQQISRLEEKTLREAPWQLKGEIDASKRPQNSLLEEVLDFDLTTRPPPIITEQTTVTLEGLIRQRIKDKAWDDVIRKEKPVDDQLMFKKPEVLDMSKSKLSLAQVYETEYLKQKQALSKEIEDEKEPESHTEIRDAMSKLFSKLDALCHYHYTPKPPQAEVKIVSNTPAISMEEVAPVATSDAALLAPEEVKRKRKGELMSKEERTKTDKNRERRKKKMLQQKKGQVMKVTEHTNTKKGVDATDKSLKTSKAFFQQLNNEASSLIKKKSKKITNNKQQ